MWWLIPVGVVLLGLFVFGLAAAAGSPTQCTGDALSGFLPCDNYPDCDC